MQVEAVVELEEVEVGLVRWLEQCQRPLIGISRWDSRSVGLSRVLKCRSTSKFLVRSS